MASHAILRPGLRRRAATGPARTDADPGACLGSRMISALFKRIQLFEALAVANFVALMLLIPESLPIVGSPLRLIGALAASLSVEVLVCIAVRSVIALARRDRAWFRRIVRRDWILDTVRIVGFGALAFFDYGWMKLVVPVYHPVLFDEQLWQVDRLLFLGLSPAEFMVNLFSGPAVLAAVDWSYSNIFLVSLFVGFGYFASEPSRRIRMAFANGNTVLWLTSAWLYLAIPSLGPAFRFPDIWFAHSEALRVTQGLQTVLMRNYQNVIAAASGRPAGRIVIMYGVAAFPSMHVAFQAYMFLWMRRLWTSGEVLFGVFALVIFLGSMITGWHYLIDGIVGLVMAVAVYRLVWRRARMGRFLALRNAISR
jgi:hypothetical protein